MVKRTLTQFRLVKGRRPDLSEALSRRGDSRMKGAGMLVVVSLKEFQIWSRLEYSGLRLALEEI